MNRKTYVFLVTILSFFTLITYLAVQAPPPLKKEVKQEKTTFSIEQAFRIVAKENDIARSLYTKAIVGQGKKAGLKFDENWRDAHIEAGPLPALFLRSTAENIERNKAPLGLYLGSDQPIRQENLFSGVQMDKFQALKMDEEPKFFYDQSIERYIAMFPDFAAAQPCVSCHNAHKDSPKNDWELNDIMGATTWTYPKDSLSTDEVLDIIRAYREGVAYTYKTYLDKVTNFEKNNLPEIGGKWPNDSTYVLPNLTTFQDSLENLTSKETILSLLK